MPKTRGPRKARAKAAAKKPARAKTAAHSGEDLRHQFVSIVMRIGTDEAQRLLDRVVDVQTPTAAIKD